MAIDQDWRITNLVIQRMFTNAMGGDERALVRQWVETLLAWMVMRLCANKNDIK